MSEETTNLLEERASVSSKLDFAVSEGDVGFNFGVLPVPTEQPNENVQAHLKTLQSLESIYGTDFKLGLTRTVVEYRRSLNGSNVLNLPSSSVFRIFRWWMPASFGLILSKLIQQFMEPLLILLLISAVVSLILGQVENAISIGVAVAIVGTVGFIQEYRTERSLEALKKLAPPRCRVLRDAGRVWDILAEDLVVGDVVELVMGDRVPADLILITANDLQVDESILTGENSPVKKQGIKATEDDKQDKVLMGTLVRQGRARGLVTAIGLKTEFGRLAVLMHETEERRSPLQIRLDHLGNQLTIYSVGVIILISIAGFFLHRRSFMETFTVAVSLAVAAIPEGLPIVATITLALGVLRLAKRGVVVKKLPAVEALGSMSVLCADKTGTLTMNEMTVDAIFSLESSETDLGKSSKPDVNSFLLGKMWTNTPELAKIAWYCNDAVMTNGSENRWQGNSTDIAFKKLLTFSPITGVRVVESVPFNSATKMMAVKVCYDEDQAEEWLIKGAPEILMSRATEKTDPKLISALEEFNRKGYRVIALGRSSSSQAEDVKLIGLMGLIDPCREGMLEMVQSLHSASIQTIMITGDSRDSASEVGMKIGWIKSRDVSSCSILSGDEMIKSSAAAQQAGNLRTFLGNLAVIYRATPEQKLHLVRLLQSIDHVVAMTGDGVNDAPALKLADIGIAMGGSNGSDVAREAANIIMTGDELSRVIEGIAEGRAIFRNIRHFVRFQLGVSFAALGLMSVTTMLHLTAPLTALQILLINIIMDGPPAQSLGVEPTTPASVESLLALPPVESNARILPRGMIIQTALMSTIMISCTMLGYPLSQYFNMKTPVLLTYATFVTCTIAYALTCRSSTRSVLFCLPSGGPFSNNFLNLSLLLTGVMLFTTCYVEFFRGAAVSALTLNQWTLPACSVISIILMDEIVKGCGRFVKNYTLNRINSVMHKPITNESHDII